jgi:hypothetical protein
MDFRRIFYHKEISKNIFPTKTQSSQRKLELLTSKLLFFIEIVKFLVIYFNLNLCVLFAFVGYNFEFFSNFSRSNFPLTKLKNYDETTAV